jgi:hypothetical protein
MPVVTAHAGNNAQLIAEVCRLYAPPGSRIADVTYGSGRFWKQCPPAPDWELEILGSDVAPAPGVDLIADLRALPYADTSMDVVVLDPPYVHNSGVRNGHDYAATTTRYNGRSVAAMYNADIMELYRQGLAEAFRVLVPEGGTCWVKCKDEVEREIQRWSHVMIHQMALEIGFCARDLFVLTGSTSPQRWPGRIQRHARKNHSYLWIFQRPDERYRKLLSRPAPSGLAAPRRDG